MVCHLTRPLLNGDFDCFQTLFITVLQQTSLPPTKKEKIKGEGPNIVVTLKLPYSGAYTSALAKIKVMEGVHYVEEIL